MNPPHNLDFHIFMLKYSCLLQKSRPSYVAPRTLTSPSPGARRPDHPSLPPSTTVLGTPGGVHSQQPKTRTAPPKRRGPADYQSPSADDQETAHLRTSEIEAFESERQRQRNDEQCRQQQQRARRDEQADRNAARVSVPRNGGPACRPCEVVGKHDKLERSPAARERQHERDGRSGSNGD